MAIYRTGKASMDANGIVTGYGTKWRKSLSLIRVGATIVFIDTPAYATIIDVVSDTELRVTDTGGKVVPQSEYVILLHDSLSVDGLAQDVAETLRYYQGKENEFAHFIDLVQNMDLEEIEKVIAKMKEEVAKFEENYKKIEAKAQEVADNAEKVATDKQVVAANVALSEQFANEAEGHSNQAQQYSTEAAQSVDEAKGQVQLAANQVGLARDEVTKAQGEVSKAAAEVGKAAAEVEKAKQVVTSAKDEIKADVAGLVNAATAEADRAKSEADRAAELADQMDTTKVMLKDNNLSDLTDKAAARRNLGVDSIEHDDLETRVFSKSKNFWLSIRNAAGKPWGVYDNVLKKWIALGIEQGGTGATDLAGARSNLQVNRLAQGNAKTELATANNKYKLFVGDNGLWGAIGEDGGALALPLTQGGTGALSASGARDNLGIDRFIQENNMTRILSNDSKTELRIGQDEWYVYRTAQDSTAGFISLGIEGGGTGADNPDDARANLKAAGVDVANTFTQKQKFNNTIELGSNAGNPLLIKSANPCIRFEETDAPAASSAKAYMLVVDGGNIRMQENNTGDGATVFNYDQAAKMIRLPKIATNDASGTRDNLGLGSRNTPSFGGATLDSYTDTDVSASGILTMRGYNAAGTTQKHYGRIYSEKRTDGKHHLTFHLNNGSVNRYASLNQDGDFTISGSYKCSGSAYIDSGRLELGTGSTASAYIDFHYNPSKYDYDARIICDGMNTDANGGGNLRFFGGFMEFKAAAGFRFNGGRIASVYDGEMTSFTNMTANQANYIIGKNADNSNRWYVGIGSANSTIATFHNYAQNCRVELGDRIKLTGKDTECGSSLHVNGSSVYVKGGSGTNNTHYWLQNSSGKNRGVIYAADAGVLSFRADLASTGATGKGMSLNGSTGALTVASVSQTSDERAKFWIKPVTGALDKVCALNGVTFSMHPTVQSTVRNAGVIAQDVQKVLPEAVTENKTDKLQPVLDKNCQPVENPLTVDYNALSALYIEAIKELKAEVDSLKAEIAALKAK